MIEDILNTWEQLQDLNQQLNTEYARLGLGRNLSFLTLPSDITARVTASYLAAFEARLKP